MACRLLKSQCSRSDLKFQSQHPPSKGKRITQMWITRSSYVKLMADRGAFCRNIKWLVLAASVLAVAGFLLYKDSASLQDAKASSRPRLTIEVLKSLPSG